MAYSGTTTFNMTATQICTRALAKLKGIDTSNNETIATQDYTDMLQQLNMIVKRTMATKGVLPWVRAYNVLILAPYQTLYELGPNTTDDWTSASNLVVTTMAAAGGSGGSTVTLTSVTGLANSMFLVFQTVNPNTNLPSTVTRSINGIVGKVVTLNSSITAPIANGTNVYGYTTLADRPQKILEINRAQNYSLTTQTTNPVTMISLQEYMMLPNRNQAGIPLQANFANKIPSAELALWQPFDGVSGWQVLICLCDTIIEDFVNTTDNPYFPVEWCDYLVFQLAFEMSFEHPVSKIDRDDLKMVAAQFLDELLDYTSALAEDSLRFGLEYQRPPR